MVIDDLSWQRADEVVRAVLRLNGENGVRKCRTSRFRSPVHSHDEVGERSARRAEIRRRKKAKGVCRGKRDYTLLRNVNVEFSVRRRSGDVAVCDERAG